MTMTVLDRAPVTAAHGQVADADQGRPEPEMPARARRRTFTAKYKLDVLSLPTTRRNLVSKVRSCAATGWYSRHIVEWAAGPRHRGVGQADRPAGAV